MDILCNIDNIKYVIFNGMRRTSNIINKDNININNKSDIYIMLLGIYNDINIINCDVHFKSGNESVMIFYINKKSEYGDISCLASCEEFKTLSDEVILIHSLTK